MPETKKLIWIGIFISHHLRNPKFGYGHWGCPCHKLGAKSGGVLGVCLSNLLYRHLYSSNWNGFGSIQFISIHTQCDCLFKLVHIASLCIGYEQDDQAGGRMREKTNMERNQPSPSSPTTKSYLLRLITLFKIWYLESIHERWNSKQGIKCKIRWEWAISPKKGFVFA